MQQRYREIQELHWVSNFFFILVLEKWLGNQPPLIIEFSVYIQMLRSETHFFSASFALYWHYLIPEIMRSHTVMYFDTLWQMASHNGTLLWKYMGYLAAYTMLDTSASWCYQEGASYLEPQRDPARTEKSLPRWFLGIVAYQKSLWIRLPSFKAAFEKGIQAFGFYIVVDLTSPKI